MVRPGLLLAGSARGRLVLFDLIDGLFGWSLVEAPGLVHIFAR